MEEELDGGGQALEGNDGKGSVAVLTDSVNGGLNCWQLQEVCHDVKMPSDARKHQRRHWTLICHRRRSAPLVTSDCTIKGRTQRHA